MLPAKVYEQEGEAVTDSLLIGDGFEKNHNEVLKDMRLLQEKVKAWGGISPHLPLKPRHQGIPVLRWVQKP